VGYADIFLQIYKKFCRNCEDAIFLDFWHLFYLIWLFRICEYSRPKTHSFTKVSLSHIFAVLKASNECTCDRDQDKTSNLRDWDSKNGNSRDQDQISRPSLPNMQWGSQYSLWWKQCTAVSEPVTECQDPFLRGAVSKVSGLVSVSKVTGFETLNIA